MGVMRPFHSAQHNHLLFREPHRKQKAPSLLHMNICALVTLWERALEVSFRDKYYKGKHPGKVIAKRGPGFRRCYENMQL